MLVKVVGGMSVGGAIFIFVLIAGVLLVCTPRSERRLALVCMGIVGAAIWLVVRIRVHSILGDFIGSSLAAAWEYREAILLAFAAAVVVVVPIAMLWMAVDDHFARHARAKALERILREKRSSPRYRRG